MTRELQCPDCEFMIRSESTDQLVEMVQQHAKESHDMEMSRSDVMDIARTV
ncbi:DUF1059 domain-containing protein [Halorarius halobius]|uniref:DUF1059 domain-containing protein n=1 Tax=Halorarius halobius TaxID=2962671 RepID=UPI0020CDC3C3|nr:DUF1059 domain-containing protein [Halorarius halobius]